MNFRNQSAGGSFETRGLHVRPLTNPPIASDVPAQQDVGGLL
jgi:hypothetical protein